MADVPPVDENEAHLRRSVRSKMDTIQASGEWLAPEDMMELCVELGILVKRWSREAGMAAMALAKNPRRAEHNKHGLN